MMTETRKPLPPQYAWLKDAEAPRIIEEALKLHGVAETPGPVNTAEIMAWARETGLERDYVADQVPWCGLFAAVVVKRAGWPVVDGPLWARNWAKWGLPVKRPGLGDVLAFKRGSGGHVGFYIGEDAEAYHVLGGNQGDAVSIVRIPKNRLLAARRPKWRIAQPASVQSRRLAATGALSSNEA
jgi:uncharacterized protein (TIGR02594 family)